MAWGAAAIATAVAGSAHAAGVHWDAGVEVGAIERITTGRGSSASIPWPGPVAELHAHVAVVPMLRAGAYVAHDVSPAAGVTAREITEGGLRLKLTPPIFGAPWKGWVFVGLGYARAYAPSWHTSSAPGGFVPGEGGGMLDLPVGLGVGARVHGPWMVFLELGTRVGLTFTGTMYDAHRCACGTAFEGRDSFAAALAVGVSLEE